MMSKIFVTGASGFIGSNIIERLKGNGNRIIALAREASSICEGNVEFAPGDILDIDSYTNAMVKCDMVFHCAAFVSFRKKDFKEAYQVNVLGTRNILETAQRRGVKKVVHLSACAVLGLAKSKNDVRDETANPLIKKNNIYAYTKKLAEAEVQKFVQKGLNVSIASIATVYGKGDRKLNSGALIKAVFEGKMKVIPPGGTSFVPVDDLVSGLILLAQKGRPGERYIFASENITYRELVQRIASALGVKPPPYVLPRMSFYPLLGGGHLMELLSGSSQNKTNLLNSQIIRETFGYKYFSSAKARKNLGWHPRQSLEAAVKQAFTYYEHQGMIKKR